MNNDNNLHRSEKSASSLFTLADTISIDQYGGIVNDSSTTARSANVAAFNAMVAAVNSSLYA